MDTESPIRKRPKGRTLIEFQPLKPAEQKLLDACADGAMADIAKNRPEKPTDTNVIRANFIRFLALGGDEAAPVHETGVWVEGAWIEGELDLQGAETSGSLSFSRCTFNKAPIFIGAHIQGFLLLPGSHVPELKGQRLKCDSDVFLTNQFQAEGTVFLLGAQIGGDLDCSGAFKNAGSTALAADRIEVGGNIRMGTGFVADGMVRLIDANIGASLYCDGGVFNNANSISLLADGANVDGNVNLTGKFASEGAVHLIGAQIGGGLYCNGGTFQNPDGKALWADRLKVAGNVHLGNEFIAKGEVHLFGTQIGGDFYCDIGPFTNPNGCALSAERLDVRGAFILRESIIGKVNFASAHVNKLADDVASWREGLYLNGFTYDSIAGSSPTDAKSRLEWLDKQIPEHSGKGGSGTEFKPQPWVQLQKVLREMGHNEDARRVAIALEDRRRHCGLIGKSSDNVPGWAQSIHSRCSKILHWMFGFFTGYGYRPYKLLYWMFGVWLFCTGIFYIGNNNGVFAPINPLVFQNPADASCRPQINKRGSWTRCPQLPAEYPGFHPLVYSLNVLLPVVDLQQESAWGPITPKMVKTLGVPLNLGWLTQIMVWLETLFGWIASLLLIAVVSGLTKKDNE